MGSMHSPFGLRKFGKTFQVWHCGKFHMHFKIFPPFLWTLNQPFLNFEIKVTLDKKHFCLGIMVWRHLESLHCHISLFFEFKKASHLSLCNIRGIFYCTSLGRHFWFHAHNEQLFTCYMPFFITNTTGCVNKEMGGPSTMKTTRPERHVLNVCKKGELLAWANSLRHHYL